MMAGPQPPVDYTNRDWSSSVQMMLDAALVLMPSWAQTTNDFGVVLVELFAYPFDVLNFYVDRAANEAFLATATQRTSVLALAEQLNYTPNGSQAATANVVIQLPNTISLTIPAGTEFDGGVDSDGDPIIFSSNVDVVVVGPGGTGIQNINVAVTAGNVVTGEVLGISCGYADSDYTLAENPVIDGTVVVKVTASPDGTYVVWTPVNNLLDYGPSDNVYETSLDTYGGVTVLFGDNISGRIPPTGAVITADYKTGGGADSNVAQGSIDEMIDPTPVYAAGLAPTDTFTVNNPNPASGGADPESTDSIRANAPLALKTTSGAITMSDYEALALQVPTIAKANATAVVYTNVILYVAPSAGAVAPTSAQLAAVSAAFVGKTIPGVVVTPTAPTYTRIDVTVSAVAEAQYARTSVNYAVNAAITDWLAFDNVDFAQRVNLADLFHTLMSVSGVSYVNITVMARSGGSTAADIVMGANEIPVLGTVNLTTTGGTGAGS
jgi:hypothetical protein